MVMEQQEVVEELAPEIQTQEKVVRKRLQLDWIESEWFQVWLKLARGEHRE